MAQIACQKGFKPSMPSILFLISFGSRCQFESGSGSCWAKGAIEDALKKKRRSLPYTMKSSVFSAEIPLDSMFCRNGNTFNVYIIAKPSLEFVDKKMQTLHKRMVI